MMNRMHENDNLQTERPADRPVTRRRYLTRYKRNTHPWCHLVTPTYASPTSRLTPMTDS